MASSKIMSLPTNSDFYEFNVAGINYSNKPINLSSCVSVHEGGDTMDTNKLPTIEFETTTSIRNKEWVFPTAADRDSELAALLDLTF
jgi:hypothetical protein